MAKIILFIAFFCLLALLVQAEPVKNHHEKKHHTRHHAKRDAVAAEDAADAEADDVNAYRPSGPCVNTTDLQYPARLACRRPSQTLATGSRWCRCPRNCRRLQNVEAGVDADAEAEVDAADVAAETDAGTDAGFDAGADAGTDAGADAAASDVQAYGRRRCRYGPRYGYCICSGQNVEAGSDAAESGADKKRHGHNNKKHHSKKSHDDNKHH